MLDKIKPFIPVIIPILEGIVAKTDNKIDDAALKLVIAILEEILKMDLDGE